MKKFVIGDIHGAYKALKQCLKRAGFNYMFDQLIVLGDVVDGWPETPQVIELLSELDNLIMVEGNHDTWAFNWFNNGDAPDIWTLQGGQATIDAYIANGDLLYKHRKFFTPTNFHRYYIDDNRLFVHGGFKLGEPIEEQSLRYLSWDRALYDERNNELDISPFREVFVGHTSTWNISKLPFNRNGVWFLDQGAGWEGKLTIMNIDTHEFWQSDKVSTLYPDVKGR